MNFLNRARILIIKFNDLQALFACIQRTIQNLYTALEYKQAILPYNQLSAQREHDKNVTVVVRSMYVHTYICNWPFQHFSQD